MPIGMNPEYYPSHKNDFYDMHPEKHVRKGVEKLKLPW